MPRVPLQIAARAAKAPPKTARFTARDVPGTIRQPGEKGYHGPHEGQQKDWEYRATGRNIHEEYEHDIKNIHAKYGRIIYGIGGGMAASGVGGGVALDRFGNRQAKKVRSRSVAKARWVPRWHAADPLIRHATPLRGGAHDISSMPRKPGRERRVAEWIGENPERMRAVYYGGFGVGTAGLFAGAHTGGKRVKTAGQDRKKQLAAQRRANMAKALYQHEQHLSPTRTALAAGGVGLAAWGLGRSGMVGRALGNGIRLARANESHRAVEALQLAQAAQGVLRRATAPGERALRQVQAVDRAVRAVPAPIRPEVATAAGLLLAGEAMPVRRERYKPVSRPIPVRPMGW